MLLALTFSLVGILLPPLVFLLAWFLSARSASDREKSSPFECGFDPKSSARIPFSLRFFLLAVIFLVFDIEIALILPLPLSFLNFHTNTIPMLSSFIFFFILIIGLLHEWREGSLNWNL